jgi:HK97 gp10 family phage protein
MSVVWVNYDAFKKRLNQRLTTNVKKNAIKAVTRGASVVQEVAVKSITGGNKSGVTRTLYNPNRTHTSSAQGEAPASDTGFLVSNINTKIKTFGNTVVGQVRSEAPYSKALEFGTTKIMARPFLQPALTKSKRKIKTIFKSQGLIK